MSFNYKLFTYLIDAPALLEFWFTFFKFATLWPLLRFCKKIDWLVIFVFSLLFLILLLFIEAADAAIAATILGGKLLLFTFPFEKMPLYDKLKFVRFEFSPLILLNFAVLLFAAAATAAAYARLNAPILFILLFPLLFKNCVLVKDSFFAELFNLFNKPSPVFGVGGEEESLTGAIITDEEADAVDNGEADGNDDAELFENSLLVFNWPVLRSLV